MKIYISLIILAALALTIDGKGIPEAIAELTKGLRQICVDETKVAEDLIEKGGNGEFSDKPEFKCYLKCVMAQMNFISETGVIDFDGMAKIIPPDFKEVGMKMLNDCRGTTGSDSCDAAYNLHVCFHKSNPEEYFLV